MRKENSTNFNNEVLISGACSMASALAQIDGRWKLTILSQLFICPTLRFSELKVRIQPISEKMLSQQLNELVKDALVLKTVIIPKPLRIDYSLTAKGLSLEPVLMSLFNWGKSLNKLEISPL